MNVLLIFFAYLLGSIPFGVVVAKTVQGIDPREHGSKNTGATNVARLCGTKWGVLVLLLDVFKGWLPVYLAEPDETHWFAVSLVALAAILGHCYSMFLGFKGGKAVATSIGAVLGVSFWLALFPVLCCASVIACSGFVALGSLTFGVTLPIFAIFTGNVVYVPLSLGIMAILFYRHRENIARLASGEENGWVRK